jgi:hypothetical protein
MFKLTDNITGEEVEMNNLEILEILRDAFIGVDVMRNQSTPGRYTIAEVVE